MKMQKKGQFSLDMLPTVGILFVVAVVTLGIGSTILAQVQSTQGDASNVAYNVSGYGLTSMASLGGWFPTFAIIIAAVIVLGMLSYLYLRRR